MKLNPINVAIVAAIASIGMPALAQQAGTQLERVEVTGSRILSVNAVSPAPVQVMSAADISAAGVANIQDLLIKNPAIGVPGLSRSNSNFLTSGAGVATIDLRNLGSSRTLVLINGRRMVSGTPGDSAVDLNTIPTDFIERVELLTGGASSTYGSDAVAGVVNIILKRNFNGLNLDAQVGQSSKSDDKKKKFSATWGASNDKSSLMAHIGVSRQGEVRSANRDGTTIDTQSLVAAGRSKDAADFYKTGVFLSGFAPAGHFFDDAADYTIDANGNMKKWSQNGPAGDGVNATGFNRTEWRRIAVPVDRVLLASKGEFQINESHQAFFEGTYANTKSSSNIEPFPLASDAIFPDTDGTVPAYTTVNGQKIRNPLVPSFVTGDGYFFQKRMSDFGPRHQDVERDTFRVLGGVKGELTKTWSYEGYIGYGSTKESQTGTGQVNVLNFKNALQAIPDGKGGVMCADALARAQGCAPANVFGTGTMSADAIAYIQAPQSLQTKITQKIAGASVSGEPFELPAGAVGVAAGLEWRNEGSSTVYDALTQAGLNGGNKLPNTKGDFTVKEAFAEVRLPLLKDLKMVKTLDGTLAYRVGDYSTVGNTRSWNAGLDWAANNTVRVRLTQAVSTRAPNINELYQGASQTFPQVTDPCQGVKITDTGELATRCKAAPGVTANMNANGGVFTLTQPDLQGVSGYDSGNPNLKAEKGTSRTLGLVITPKDIAALKNFTFTADYFDIEISKAINNPGRDYTLDQCYNGGDQAFCKFIIRRPVATGAGSAGALQFINQAPVNSGGQKAKGIDFTSSYSDRLGAGRVNARLSYTRLLDAWNKATDDAELDKSVGEIGSPKNKWSLALGYDIGNWSVATTTTYWGESYLDDQGTNKYLDPKKYNGFTKDTFRIGSVTYFDAQVTYKMGKAAQLYFGVDNLLDTKAPFIPSGLPGNTTGTNTNASTYDAIGRRGYIGIRYNM
ncbi:TonB-dependent receptor [Paucibacter sp. APW11]|uniref:TonB-dependent receptor n=1 Tax=Roseateles aquae TaxID=3077235 RepID=A0ABU3P9Y4_9BURK|nr:TonB-dependent receptor [Paucibacter sp. APW11]MDT8999394.1 TonB-dependent receptor [Paucibacter sp. APW11]